jgi:hypothetical protein
MDAIYYWQRGTTQAYDATDTLLPGEGYWIWAYANCQLLLPSNAAAPSDRPITDLLSKWNVMGLPYATSLAQTALDIVYSGTHYTWAEATTGADPIILGFIYGWDSSSQMYAVQTTIEPGQGYWMYAYHDCSLYRGD